MQDKNFYVLTLLQQDVKARAELAADPALAAIVKKTAMEMTKEGTIAPAARDLEARAQAGARSMTFSDDDIVFRSRRRCTVSRSPASAAKINCYAKFAL